MFSGSNQCVPAGEECIQRYGTKGIPISNNVCGCAYGYHLDSVQKKCVEDAKPARIIPANVKDWVDDNYAKANVQCSSNPEFSPEELIVCDEYNNSFIRQKYDWKVAASPPVMNPAASPVIPAVAIPAAPVKPLAAPTPIVVQEIAVPAPVKPKVTEQKPRESIKEVATTSRETALYATQTVPVIEEKQPPQEISQPKQKSLWSRVVGWFKFW